MIKKSTFIFFLILLYTVISCDMEDFEFDLPKVIKLPALITYDISNINSNSASCNSEITFNGGAPVIASGVCYAKTSNPTTSNSYVLSGTSSSSFYSLFNELSPNTTYYVRAFASNSVGTGYGNQMVFKTLSTIATITTTSVTSITAFTATSGGIVHSDGGSSVDARGVCYATTSNPTINNNYVLSGTGVGAFTSKLTGLSPNTTYYVRAFAQNEMGLAYGGSQYSFTTNGTLPSVTTSDYSYGSTSATIYGNVTSDGGSYVNARGVVYATTSNPTTSNSYVLSGTGIGAFTSNLTGLSPNTTYYVRAFAINSYGTAYGTQYSFTTSGTLPSVTTSDYSYDSSSATVYGNVTSDGGSDVYYRGVVYATTSNPTTSNSYVLSGTGIGAFTSNLTGLSPNTTYYVRAFAINSYGTAYGSTISFTTSSENLTVGQSYQGGIIAYIFAQGDTGYVAGQTHGLIATTSNQSTSAQWGCSGISINTSSYFGTGQNNTTLIVNSCSTANIAARICNNLVTGGYSDWYLPSWNELLKVYSNKTGIGGFSDTYYWSSSQYTLTNSVVIYFSSGSAYSFSKTSSAYVRAIRKF